MISESFQLKNSNWLWNGESDGESQFRDASSSSSSAESSDGFRRRRWECETAQGVFFSLFSFTGKPVCFPNSRFPDLLFFGFMFSELLQDCLVDSNRDWKSCQKRTSLSLSLSQILKSEGLRARGFYLIERNWDYCWLVTADWSNNSWIDWNFFLLSTPEIVGHKCW